MSFTHGWLVSDWDSRDPDNQMNDIDCAGYLEAMQQLPQSVRQMMEDGDCHVEVDLIDDHWRVTKIVKKREPEFQSGTETSFVRDEDGRRLAVTDEELGIAHDPDDVLNQDDDVLQTLEHDYTCPRDKWDVVFDATECIRESRRAIKACRNSGVTLTAEALQSIADESIYSANWYPYSQDKRIHSARGKEIARAIAKGVTRAQLARMLRDPAGDDRFAVAENLKARALTMPLGRQRADLLRRSVELKAAAAQASGRRTSAERSADRQCGPRVSFSRTISAEEKNKLWSLWRDKEIETKGSVELMPWQFERALRAKLQRSMAVGEITLAEASVRFSERMREHYGVEVTFQRKTAQVKPQWAPQAPVVAKQEDDYEFACGDWFETQAQVFVETE